MKETLKFSQLNIGDTFMWKTSELVKTGARRAKKGKQEFIFSLSDLVAHHLPAPQVTFAPRHMDKVLDHTLTIAMKDHQSLIHNVWTVSL